MLTEQQRKLITINLAQEILRGLPSDLNITITMYNENADEHPEQGLERVNEVTKAEREELILMALRVALMDLESR